MHDREKVIKWLEKEIKSNDYWDEDYIECIPVSMLKDILALLKAQEPRVITREELKQFDEYPCWFESHGTYMGKKGFWIIPYAFTCYETMHYVYPLMQINERGDCHFSEMGLSAYNKAWRCWTAMPTDEQRKEAKWDA